MDRLSISRESTERHLLRTIAVRHERGIVRESDENLKARLHVPKKRSTNRHQILA